MYEAAEGETIIFSHVKYIIFLYFTVRPLFFAKLVYEPGDPRFPKIQNKIKTKFEFFTFLPIQEKALGFIIIYISSDVRSPEHQKHGGR